MKVPWKWLSEYCSSPWPVEETADRLTMVGVSVEGVSHERFEGKGIVTARIVSVSPHPGRKGLSVGVVDTGSKTYRVVSGAPGFRPGVVTAFAPPGSRLPRSRQKQGVGEGDRSPAHKETPEVSVREIYGVLSEGMVLSANEILTGEGPRPGEDILLLSQNTAAGLPLDEVLELDDYVLELDLTPSFSHCLSIIGVAVELSALSGAPVRLPHVLESWSFLNPGGSRRIEDVVPAGAGGHGTDRGMLEVVLEDPDLCPHYVGKTILGVKACYSPIETERRLYLAGMRPINALVDATNYAMLETGQPLHAFDLDKLEGGLIRIRRSRAGESLVTLDGVLRDLPVGTLVIVDGRGPVAIAGIMGGKGTEVSGTTRNVFLESAWFDPRSVRASSSRLGLRTEAQLRFEKGIDPTAQVPCAERATELITRVCGGRPVPGWSRAIAREVPPKKATLDLGYLQKVLGQRVENERASGVLKKLGFSTLEKEGEIEVLVPPRRVDVSEQVDLIEEVARYLGYGNFRGQPLKQAVSPGIPAEVAFEERVKDVLRSLGGSEALTNPLIGPADISAMGWDAGDPRANPIKVQNPLNSDESYMRTSLLPGLIRGLETNKRYRTPGVVIWEIGTVFFPSGEELPVEKRQLAVATWGTLVPKTWNTPALEAGFYYIKGLVESLLSGLGIAAVGVEKRASMPFHPGRSCKVLSGGVTLGEMGEVHPLVLEKYDLEKHTALAWFDLGVLMAMSRETRYRPVPRFPRIERDLAVIAPEELEVGAIERLIRRESKHLLTLTVFDLWRGSPVPAGMKSIAFSMVFGAEDRTLTDEEVNAEIRRIVDRLGEELGVKLR